MSATSPFKAIALTPSTAATESRTPAAPPAKAIISASEMNWARMYRFLAPRASLLPFPFLLFRPGQVHGLVDQAGEIFVAEDRQVGCIGDGRLLHVRPVVHAVLHLVLHDPNDQERDGIDQHRLPHGLPCAEKGFLERGP